MAWVDKVKRLTCKLGREPTLDELLKMAVGYRMTAKERAAQRASWARSFTWAEDATVIVGSPPERRA